MWQQLEGFGGRRQVAFPAWPPVFFLRKKPSLLLVLPPLRLPPLSPSPFACGLELKGVTRGALGRGEGGAAPEGGASPQPGLVAPAVDSAVGPPPGLAGCGGVSWRRAIGRVWRGGAAGRRAGAFASGWGAPRQCRETSPAPTGSPPHRPRWQPKFSGRKCNGFCFFFPPKKEAPGSHSFSEVGVDVCLAGGGRETSPLQAPSLFPQTGVSLCKIGSFPEPPFSHL